MNSPYRHTRALSPADAHRFLFAQAMDISHDMAFIVDLEGRFTYLNSATGELIGRRPEEVIGRFLWDAIPDPERIAVMMETTLAYGQWGGEVACERADGSTVPVRLRTVLIQSKDGELLGVVGMGWDMTTDRELESQLVAFERQRLLGQIADGVAHDLNNSLAGILGYAELLGRLPDVPEVAKEYARIIEASAGRAAELVERIHQAAGSGPPARPDAVDVNEVVRSAAVAAQPRWQTQAQVEGRVISVEMVLGASHTVDGRASEIDEVVTNLLFNAVDAMPGGGTITLETRDEGEWVCLSVTDTGIGMDRQTVRRLGEMFFTTKGAKGHGVGIAVCYRLVEGMSGRIDVSSKPGVGTTFDIRLPVGKLGADAPATGPAPDVSGLNLLVIDDDEQILALIEMALDRCSVTCAPDGAEGLSALTKAKWDAVLVDLTMPGMSGLEVGDQINFRHPDLPIVLMTGWKCPSDESVSSFAAVLPKPFSIGDLKRCLDRVTGRGKGD